MPNWVLVDDAERWVGYSTGWSIERGSSRQWGSAVHATTLNGASAQLMFKGISVIAFVTIPVGSGTQRIQYTIDGGSPRQLNLQQSKDTQYNVEFMRVTGLSEGNVHSLIVTNMGSGSDAALHLDRFEYLPGDSDPNPDPIAAPAPTVYRPPVSSSSSSSSKAPIVTSNPSTDPPASASPDPAPQPQPNNPPLQPSPSVSQPNDDNDKLPTSSSNQDQPPSVATDVISSNSRSSSESVSLPTGSALALNTQNLTTVFSESGRLVTRTFTPSVTYRIITVTDANGGVSTQTQAYISQQPSGGLSKGAVTGIVVGCLMGVAAMLGVVILVVCLKRKRGAGSRSRGRKYGDGLNSNPDTPNRSSPAPEMSAVTLNTNQSNSTGVTPFDVFAPPRTSISSTLAARTVNVFKERMVLQDIPAEGQRDTLRTLVTSNANDPPPSYSDRSSFPPALTSTGSFYTDTVVDEKRRDIG